MRALWVEDKYIQPSEFGLENAILCKNMESAFEFIANHQDEFDAVVLDINLEIGMKIESVFERLKEIVPISRLIEMEENREAELQGKAGLYLFLYLLNQGFPKERICFLTGNKSVQENPVEDALDYLEGYRLQIIQSEKQLDQFLERMKDQTTLKDEVPNKETIVEDLSEICDEVYDVVDEEAADLIGEYKGAFQFHHVYEQLTSYQEEVKKEEEERQRKQQQLGVQVKEDIPRNTFDSFKRTFEKIGLRAPRGFKKHEQNDQMKSWIKEGTTPYYQLRRCLIDYSKMAREALIDKTNGDKFLAFHERFQNNSGDKIEVYDSSYFEEMLESFEKLLPIREPEDEHGKKMYYLQMIKKLSQPWEGIKHEKGHHYLYKIYFQTMKLLRNWTAHSKLQLVNSNLEGDLTFIILISYHAFFDMELLTEVKDEEDLLIFKPGKKLYKSRLEIEQKLFSLIDEHPISFEELTDMIKNTSIPIYPTLDKLKRVSNQLQYSSSVTYYSLLEELGREVGSYEECSTISLQQLIWHGMFSGSRVKINKVASDPTSFKITFSKNWRLEKDLLESPDSFITNLYLHTFHALVE